MATCSHTHFRCPDNVTYVFYIYIVLFLFLGGGCEDRDILWSFFTNLSIESIYLSPELREKWPYLQNCHSKIFFSTQCIILLPFLSFSKKLRGDTFNPPLPKRLIRRHINTQVDPVGKVVVFWTIFVAIFCKKYDSFSPDNVWRIISCPAILRQKKN